jgi:DNA-binding CsgD family transcriptional regulator
MTATLALIASGSRTDAVVRAGSPSPTDVSGRATELLRAAVDAVTSGAAEPVDPSVAALVQLARQLTGTLSATRRVAADHRLTDREHDVLDLVARGFSVAQISRTLSVSASTVAFHLGRIYAKAGVRSRHELTELVWARSGRAA